MNKKILIGIVIVAVITITVGYLSLVLMQPKPTAITEEMARAEVTTKCSKYCASQSLKYVNDTVAPMLNIDCYCANSTDTILFKVPA